MVITKVFRKFYLFHLLLIKIISDIQLNRSACSLVLKLVCAVRKLVICVAIVEFLSLHNFGPIISHNGMIRLIWCTCM